VCHLARIVYTEGFVMLPEGKSDVALNAVLPRRSWFKFSLATLMLGGVLVAVVISHLVTSVSLKQTQARLVAEEQQVATLRDELGYFEVKDRSLINVRSVPTLEENTWKWRLYLPDQPPGRRYRVVFATQRIPAQGFDVVSRASTTTLGSESLRLWELGVHKGTDGRPQMVIDLGGGISRTILQENHALIVPADERISMANVAGEKQFTTAPANEKFELLRLRIATGGTDAAGMSTTSVPTTPCDGILVWIEPQP
jgi:hypothetical protein